MDSYRRIVDEQPGGVPDIRVDGDHIIFRLNVADEQAWLLIRCAPDGAITAAIDFRQPTRASRLR